MGRSPSVRRLLLPLAAVLAAALATALTARTGAATPPRFRTPDAEAACRLEGAALHCASLAVRLVVVLRGHGQPTLARELPWWDASTPVLGSWRDGSLACRLAGGAILCRNRTTAIRIAADGFAVAG